MGRKVDRLSAEDARILRLEAPGIMGHTCKVAVVDPAPEGQPLEVAALRRHVEARLGGAPRCRQRLAFAPLRLGNPVWVDDPSFDINHHVRAAPIEPGLSRDGPHRLGGLILWDEEPHATTDESSPWDPAPPRARPISRRGPICRSNADDERRGLSSRSRAPGSRASLMADSLQWPGLATTPRLDRLAAELEHSLDELLTHCAPGNPRSSGSPRGE